MKARNLTNEQFLSYILIEIRDDLINSIYEPAQDYLDNRAIELVKENNLLYGNHFCEANMVYKGENLRVEPDVYKSIPPHETLIDKVEDLLKEVNDLKAEEKKVRLGMKYLFSKIKCKNLLREVLGNSLYNTIAEKHGEALKYYLPSEEIDKEVLEHLKSEFKDTVEALQNRQIENLICKQLYGN